mmetsp:Transcript_33569/g.75081  ORF Transcript_33569/g.75081 Transcript_33569/m.75081 type:complete len:146 (+) Transcript_33569:28-465(+)
MLRTATMGATAAAWQLLPSSSRPVLPDVSHLKLSPSCAAACPNLEGWEGFCCAAESQECSFSGGPDLDCLCSCKNWEFFAHKGQCVSDGPAECDGDGLCGELLGDLQSCLSSTASCASWPQPCSTRRLATYDSCCEETGQSMRRA